MKLADEIRTGEVLGGGPGSGRHKGGTQEPFPVVRDYLKHLDRAVASKGAAKAQAHLDRARATYNSMTQAGKNQADSLKTDQHREWLKKAQEYL
jgi:hypothetical protein